MEYQNIKVTSRRSFNIGIVSSFAFLGLNSKSVFAENIFRLMDMEPIKITVKKQWGLSIIGGGVAGDQNTC